MTPSARSALAWFIGCVVLTASGALVISLLVVRDPGLRTIVIMTWRLWLAWIGCGVLAVLVVYWLMVLLQKGWRQ